MTINPTVCLDDEQLQIRLKSLDVIDVMRDLFLDLGQGLANQPPQVLTLFPDGMGDFITYAGVLAGQKVFGLKISPYLKTDGRPIITAYTLLMSMESGQPLMLCDSMSLTKERTAATTALAVDLLAPKNARKLAVIGSGPIALAHLKYVLPLRAWESVRISSLNLHKNSETLKARLAEMNASIEIAANQPEAIDQADVILLCTSSATPVIDITALTKPALITSISTNAPGAHEVAPSTLSQMDVYCDYRANTPDIAGEMVVAREQGWSRTDIKGDLGELLIGRAPFPDYLRHVFFRSVGLGLEDVQLALAIHLRS